MVSHQGRSLRQGSDLVRYDSLRAEGPKDAIVWFFPSRTLKIFRESDRALLMALNSTNRCGAASCIHLADEVVGSLGIWR